MKKILIGLIIGLAVGIPVSVFAWSPSQVAAPVRTYDCTNGIDSNGNKTVDNCGGVVDRFTDSGNTCYITQEQGDISCVKN